VRRSQPAVIRGAALLPETRAAVELGLGRIIALHYLLILSHQIC
jgi:hypothetical protein